MPRDHDPLAPIHTAGLTVDQYEGLYLMLYHLRMAALYFEATPTEIEHKSIALEFSYPAMRAWLAAMETLYPED